MKRILAYLITVFLAVSVLSACSAPAETSGVPNPVVEYDTPQKMEKAADLKMPVLPERYTPLDSEESAPYAVIDKKLAEARYELGGAKITFRMMKGSEDISGIYGVEEYDDETINGIDTHIGTYNGINVAWFTYGDYSYSLTAEDMNGTDFIALVNEVTALVASPPEDTEETQ